MIAGMDSQNLSLIFGENIKREIPFKDQPSIDVAIREAGIKRIQEKRREEQNKERRQRIERERKIRTRESHTFIKKCKMAPAIS